MYVRILLTPRVSVSIVRILGLAADIHMHIEGAGTRVVYFGQVHRIQDRNLSNFIAWKRVLT